MRSVVSILFSVHLSEDLARIVQDFAEHYHDAWAMNKVFWLLIRFILKFSDVEEHLFHQFKRLSCVLMFITLDI
jgi:hypothetical protein